MIIQEWVRILAIVVIILAGGQWGPTPSLAHPLGNFSISRYTGLRIERDSIELRYLIDMAEIPAFQEFQKSGMVPEVGHRSVDAYLARQAETLQEGLSLEVNGQRLALRSVEREILFPPAVGDLSTLKLGLVYRASLQDVLSPEPNRLRYRDSNFPGRSGWKEIIAVAGEGITFVHSSVPATDRSRQLTDYPPGLLNSPPQTLEAQIVFAPATQPHVIATTGMPPAASDAGQSPHRNMHPENAALPLQANKQAPSHHVFTDLITSDQLSLSVIFLALAVAAGLGVFHALEPGHGKTVVAAYLVGSHGTARHALWLGFIVTATHTAGVYVLGGVTLYASQYIVPERLYPWLGVVSGLIIASLGFYLFLQRYAGKSHAHTPGHTHGHGHTHEPRHAHAHAHAHAHSDPHGHDHGHGDPPDDPLSYEHHAHGEASHPHHREAGETVTWRQLLALGVTGGIVPCPAALVVLLSAVALQRIGFGMLLIVAFSVGLAAVLIAIGLLMVYARRFMSRFQSEGLLITRWLPLTSAGLITIFGIAMVIQALVSAGMITLHL